MINNYLLKIIIDRILSKEEFSSEVSLMCLTIIYAQKENLLHILTLIVKITLKLSFDI